MEEEPGIVEAEDGVENEGGVSDLSDSDESFLFLLRRGRGYTQAWREQLDQVPRCDEAFEREVERPLV
jgi:hypothetical protein